jgi:hypothetical protein
MMAAAGLDAAFESALRKMPAVATLAAANASPLMHVLYTLAMDPNIAGRWLTAAELAAHVATVMGAESGNEILRSTESLGKFLAQVSSDGAAVANVEKTWGHNKTHKWRISPKG